MRIAVIGGTGFIGAPVAARLAAEGHEVTVVARSAEGPVAKGARLMQADRAHLAARRAELAEAGADAIVDMIPMTVADTRPVIDLCDGLTQRYVLISSSDVYLAYGRLTKKEPGAPVAQPVPEDGALRGKMFPYREAEPRAADDPKKKMDAYDKIPLERDALARPHLPATVLRLPMVYGPRDKQRRFFDMLGPLLKGEGPVVLPESYLAWRSSFMFVENAAAAVALATTHPAAARQIYNVAPRAYPTLLEWGRMMATAAGVEPAIEARPDTDEDRETLPDFSHHLMIDGEKIRRDLGYAEPVDTPRAAVETAGWLARTA